MTDAHHRFVARQYGPRAADYLSSAVHAGGEDLDRIEAIVRDLATAPGTGDRALNLGCGGGHVSYQVAPHVAAVTAVDLSADMLEAVRRYTRERGLANVTVRQAAAEHLAFDDAYFDALLSRFSAHHWHDFEAGLREARRVLAPGGRAVFVDSLAPAPALLDTHLEAVELLRDATHVCNYAVAEWPPPSPARGSRCVKTGPTGCGWSFPAGSRARARQSCTPRPCARCRPTRRTACASISRSRRMAVSCWTRGCSR